MAGRLRFLFLLAGLAFMAVASARALGEGQVLPSSMTLLISGVLSALAVLAATVGWVALTGTGGPRVALAAGFLAAQVGKYIPGGVWVALGQVGFSMGAGLGAGRAAGALAAYAVCLVAAAGVVAGTQPFAAVPGPWVPALGLGLPLLLARPWLAWLVDRSGRWIPDRFGVVAVPHQRNILGCFACLLLALGSSAISFALLLRGSGVDLPFGRVVSGFGVAWLGGFLALGLPSGIGAREAVLVLMLGAGAGPVLAASVAHRLVQAAAEAALLLFARRHVPGAAPRSVHAIRLKRPREIPFPWRS
jgi:hypothetical protein